MVIKNVHDLKEMIKCLKFILKYSFEQIMLLVMKCLVLQVSTKETNPILAVNNIWQVM